MFWKRPLREFMVRLELDGRHPYLKGNELDYPDSHEDVLVLAKDWNDAADKALRIGTRQPAWRRRVWRVTAVPREQ